MPLPRKSQLILPFAILTCMAGAALAQATDDSPKTPPLQPGIAGGHSQAAFIASYDRDGDGQVTKEELIELRTERFLGADKDGDSVLSEAEYVAEFEGRLRQQYSDQNREIDDENFERGLKQAAVRFALLDRERNGTLSLEEDLASAESTFAGMDTNGDGVVDAKDPPRKRRNTDDDDDGDEDNSESPGDAATKTDAG